MSEEQSCGTCKQKITNDKGSVTFKCPSCKKETIVRCGQCRSIGAQYVCACGFKGPN